MKPYSHRTGAPKYAENISLSPLRARKNQPNPRRQRERERVTSHFLPEPPKRTETFCTTHLDKVADYSYCDEEQQIFYCCICAAKLASQGFHLDKLPSTSRSRIAKNHSQSNINRKPSHGKSVQNPQGGYSRLKCNKYSKNCLIKEVDDLALNVEGLLKKYANLDTSSSYENDFERQRQLVCKFYQKLADIVTQYKIKHIAKIDAQREGNELEVKEKIKCNFQELKIISEDMFSTDFDQVIENVSENDFKMCCEFYRKKYDQFNRQYTSLSSKISEIGHPRPIHKKCNVAEIQSTIDRVEKLLKDFHDPEDKYRSKSSDVQNFIREYEKETRNKSRQNTYYSNPPPNSSKNENLACGNGKISSPQFKNF